MEASEAQTARFLKNLFRGRTVGSTRQERRAAAKKVYDVAAERTNSSAFLAKLQDDQTQTINIVGVLSLSALGNQVLMWSHYAEAHTGICLRFLHAGWANPIWAAQKVLYSSHRPVVNPVIDTPQAIMDKIILTKADFWSYEEEWRVMSHPGSIIAPEGGPGLLSFVPKALDGIILGARVTESDAAEVREWVKSRKHSVEILRATPSANLFRLDIAAGK